MTLTSVILHANNSLIETGSSKNFSISLVAKVVASSLTSSSMITENKVCAAM